MNNRYKLILYNKRTSREIELSDDMQQVRIGTSKNCSIRFNKEQFFFEFEIVLEYIHNEWYINCLGNTYCSVDGIMKLSSKKLNHGDELVIKYNNVNQLLFNVSFLRDFEFEKKDYNRVIDISNIQELRFGANSNCNIVFRDDTIDDGIVTLSNYIGKYTLTDRGSRYGVYLNGVKIKQPAELKNYDFFTVYGYSFYYKSNHLYTSVNLNIKINGIASHVIYYSDNNLNYPAFNRNTRINFVIPDDKIEILNPPSKPEKPKQNIIMTIVPTIASMGVTLGLRSVIGRQSSYMIISACTMSIGIITSIYNYFNGIKEYKKSIKEREEKYNKYIENKRNDITGYRAEELSLLRDMYYDLEKDVNLIQSFSGDLFNRQNTDDDFLCVYLGTGVVKAKRVINYKQQEEFETDDELKELPKKVFDEFEYIPKAPVIVDLKLCNVLGLVGESENLYQMMKNMTIDLFTRQHYNDLQMFFIVNPSQIHLLEWVRFIPHIQNKSLNIRNFACNDDTKTTIYEYLYNEFSRREKLKKEQLQELVIFVFDEMGIKRHPVSKYIETAKEMNATFIFFENSKELLPRFCDKVLFIHDYQSGTLVSSQDQKDTCDFSYSYVDDEIAKTIANKLAPVYCEEVSLEGTLTKNISLFELLNIYDAEDLDLMNRWKQSKVYKSMAAPLGVRSKNDVVCLDLHEKAHGPHGLVAGTTGSGKSEILQSYILSAATLFHPYEVSFVIIDFKGGGMVNQFRDLPHLIGAITNIDGKQINRSLLSIKAELTKRQNYFASAGVNHIDQYIMKYKNHEVDIALPHLIIIVDEFAELKAEQPEFMKELISAARIGRSLGVHLILATQKPSGQVNEQIWSNSKFKLCLKVQTQQDSKEVIKSPLAAEIIEPGRAYFQVGNNEIFELFQSAYSGCPAKMDISGNVFKEFYISKLDFCGKREVIFNHKQEKKEGNVVTQLEAIVNYINETCKKHHIPKLQEICLPPLEELIYFPPRNELCDKDLNMTIELGIYDAPENQYQGVATYEISNNNLMIIGASRFGKTNAIQSIIRCAVEKYSPQELNIYIIDFASMILKNLESLNHVGGVVCSSEDEKLKNLFKLLVTELNIRKEKMMASGVSSFVSYKEAGYTDCPQILLILDNLTVLKELYPNEEDTLILLCREGISVGITVIIANSQLNGVGYKYMSNFSAKMALYCNDSSMYSSLFERVRITPEELPGRCIIEVEKNRFECQTFLAFDGKREIDRVIEMKAFIEKINTIYSDSRAKRVPVIPKILSVNYVNQNFAGDIKNKYSYIAGLEYASVEPLILNYTTLGVFGVAGNNKEDKLTFINYFAKNLQNLGKEDVELHIIDNINKELTNLQECDITASYSIIFNDVEKVLSEFEATLDKRQRYLLRGHEDILDTSPLLCLIVNNSEVYSHISQTKEALKSFKYITGKYKQLKVLMLFCCDNSPIAYNSPEPLKLIKETKHCFFFGNLGDFKPFDIPVPYMRTQKKEIDDGDAFYMNGSYIERIKTVFYKPNN